MLKRSHLLQQQDYFEIKCPRTPFHYAVPAFQSLWAADFVSAVFIKHTGTLYLPGVATEQRIHLETLESLDSRQVWTGDKMQTVGMSNKRSFSYFTIPLLRELLQQLTASRCPYQHKIKILRVVTGPEGKTKQWCWILAYHKPQMLFRICILPIYNASEQIQEFIQVHCGRMD